MLLAFIYLTALKFEASTLERMEVMMKPTSIVAHQLASNTDPEHLAKDSTARSDVVTPPANTTFPPSLTEADAPSWTVADASSLTQAALKNPKCRAVRDAWPSLVGRTEATLRIADDERFRRQVAELQQEISTYQSQECGPWQGLLAVQRAFLQEHVGLHAPTHVADQTRAWQPLVATYLDLAAMENEFYMLHDEACVRASQTMSIAANMWCKEAAHVDVTARRQRYIFNLATDATLVHRDGAVGGACESDQFVALAEFEAASDRIGSFASLQGQGPVTSAAKSAYVDAALAYAETHGLKNIIFVNAAEGDRQIPSFEADVLQRQPTDSRTLRYFGSDTWRDGSLVVPKNAAQFAASVASYMRIQGDPAVVVVNCNAGLDRSGMLNILIRAISVMDGERLNSRPWPQLLQESMANVPDWVRQLKGARPHAISTWGRYLFIFQALDAYVAMQIANESK